MFSKKFDKSPIFPDSGYMCSLARTLDPTLLGTQPSGWTITGEIHEDYYEWVNEFEATHPDFGRVWGDFEKEVFADSQEAYDHFFAQHPPKEWDYFDI